MQITLPVIWEVCGTVMVEADSIDEAIESFKKTQDHIPLPSDPDYVEGSFGLWTDEIEAIEFFNRNRMCTDDV